MVTQRLHDIFDQTDIDRMTLAENFNLILRVQSYIDNSFSLLVLIFSLSVALLAFSAGKTIVIVLASIMILVVISYGYFVLLTAGPILRKFPAYNRINLAFYYIEVTLLVLIYAAMIYYRSTRLV